MNNRKLKQLVKEALSNMIDEDTVDPGTEDLEDALEDPKMGGAFNELLKPASDISDTGDDPTGVSSDADDHFQNVEEMDMGGGAESRDAELLANAIDSIPDSMGGEEEIFPLHEFFGMDEMAKSANVYRLLPGKEAALIRLLKVTNQKLKDRTRSTGTQGTKAKNFTDDDLERIIDVIAQGEFTTNDLKAAHQNTDPSKGKKSQPGPQLWNNILNKQPKIDKETGDPIPKTGGVLTDLGYVELISQLKKQMEPDTSAEPKRRGRPAAPKPPSPEDEFDAPEMEPEMAPDDDPIVQQATQAQEQDPKKQAVKSFMDQMKAMGVISDTNKVLDMDTYKDEFAKFKSTMNENNFHSPRTVKSTPIGDEDKELTTVDLDWYEKAEEERRKKAGADMRKKLDKDSLNESKKSKKGLLTERFQQLAGIKPMYAINSLNEEVKLTDLPIPTQISFGDGFIDSSKAYNEASAEVILLKNNPELFNKTNNNFWEDGPEDEDIRGYDDEENDPPKPRHWKDIIKVKTQDGKTVEGKITDMYEDDGAIIVITNKESDWWKKK
jgi:hypothetical protein